MSADGPGLAGLEMALAVAKGRVAGGKTEYTREVRYLEDAIAEFKQRQKRQQRESPSEHV